MIGTGTAGNGTAGNGTAGTGPRVAATSTATAAGPSLARPSVTGQKAAASVVGGTVVASSAARRTARPAPLPASVYWRRRGVALLVGLAVLALVAWALKSAAGGFAPTAPSTAASTGLSGPASGAPAGTAGSAGTAAGHAASHHLLRPCPAGDVVLSLFSSQASYTLRQTPQFEVDVVSTASGTCMFDIGARHVLVQISAGGRTVWSSSDCAEGQASLVTRLRRGVPTIVPITWDGQHSSAGCPVPGTPAAAGTYTATAADGSAASNVLTFRIG